MPSKLTPRSRNGITVAGRSLPPARPQAATLARYLSCVRMVARVLLPTASTAPAQRSPSSGRSGFLARSTRSMIAEARQSRDGDAAESAGGASHQHFAIARLQPVPLERQDRQHGGEAGGA